MFAGLIKLFLPSLEGEALKALFDFIGNILEQRNLIAQGATQQALGEAAKQAKTQQAMSQAQANSPVSKSDALQRLNDGSA